MKPTFSVVHTMDTAEMIAQQITQMIEQGVLHPGDRLPSEAQLVAQLGVGRSSVREAKRVLAAKGIIEGHAGRGTYIAQLGASTPPTDQLLALLAQESLADLLVVRHLLEEQIVELAVRHATDADLATMEACLAHMAAAPSMEQAALDEVEFQTHLAAATHNHALARLYSAFVDVLARKTPDGFTIRWDVPEEIRELRTLLDLLRRRERKKARRLIRARATRSGILPAGDSEENA